MGENLSASFPMNSNGKTNSSGKATMGNPSILLDKLNVRKSTPDSEALASSDDEGDTTQRSFALPDLHSVPQQKPARRSSWLNDTVQSGSQLRKGSFSSSMSPTTLNTNQPMDAVTLNAHLPPAATASRAHPGSSTLWSQGIWSADASRKDASSRLAEVLPSPTSMYPPGANGGGGFYEASPQNSSRSRDLAVNPNIPFAIPLQPTLKTIRSQSYSVGQQEYDGMISPGIPGSAISPAYAGRRDRQHSVALQHRPSRPSMLSEVSNDNNGLGNVREVEDDDDESTNDGSMQGGVGLQSNEHRTIELLTRENALLRQQQSFQNVRPRARAPSVNAIGANYMSPGGHGIQESLIEESDYAVDEIDEVAELQGLSQRSIPGRRMSEYSALQGMPQHMSIENRKLENLKKGAWSTSLGFGGLSDIPQSRRHSFADTLPTRQGSVGSIGETLPQRDTVEENPREYGNRHYESIGQNANDPAAASYFSSGVMAPYPNPPSTFTSNRLPSGSFSQPAVYHPSSMYQQFGNGMSQPRHDQPLYVVLFKCSRADIFYIQEGTGLQVKPGDLCIVEADRGTDLGTVAHDSVSWAEAKKYKEHYAEEHYKWLMMYSATSASNPDGSCAGLMAAGNGALPSAIGGMGPQNSAQESTSSEIKPKIIKRVAQAHEIQALRDKEGNEAKAKRMCTQKVKEHQLKMEILDAEFQMDLKKLTFYYFAESYVNFNLLVTDLFKVYKTRIWMSAINPASFASPSAGLQAPSGVGPGAVGVRNMLPDRRTQQQQDQTQLYGSRSFDTGYTQPFSSGNDRALIPQASYSTAPADYSPYGYTPFAAAPRNMNAPMASYNPAMMQPMDSYPGSGYATPADYQTNSGRYPSPHGGILQDDYTRQGNVAGEGWMNSFQGLSLNSR